MFGTSEEPSTIISVLLSFRFKNVKTPNSERQAQRKS